MLLKDSHTNRPHSPQRRLLSYGMQLKVLSSWLAGRMITLYLPSSESSVDAVVQWTLLNSLIHLSTRVPSVRGMVWLSDPVAQSPLPQMQTVRAPKSVVLDFSWIRTLGLSNILGNLSKVPLIFPVWSLKLSLTGTNVNQNWRTDDRVLISLCCW